MSKNKKKFTGRVTLEKARAIYIALGFSTAKNWNIARLQKKIADIQTKCEGAVLKDKMQKRVDAICKYIDKGGTITIYDPEKTTGDKKLDKQLGDAKNRQGNKKTDKKDKKAKKEKKEKGPKKPGVIKSILEYIQAGKISKKAILAKLVKRFPDRESEAMAKTIQAQLPKRMSKEKDINIKVDDKGCYYLGSGKAK